MTQIKFSVPEGMDGVKVQSFLRGECSVSYSLIKKLKRVSMGITANGQHIRTIDILQAGDEVVLSIPDDERPSEPKFAPLDIIYEDEHIAVINKPYGMPVHPSPGHADDTLANAFAAHLIANGGQSSACRIVNRLDRDTTGLVLVAKNSYAASRLNGAAEKIYYAVCHGSLTGEGTIDAPIRIMEGHSIQREVGEGGVRAVTHWKSLKNVRLTAPDGVEHELTLLEIHLETGRTHQIRVHFASIGMPLEGDDMYGGSLALINRQALHCGSLSFYHPITNEYMEFIAPLPPDMARLCE